MRIKSNDIVILDKLSYRFKEVKRGDIVSVSYADTKYLITFSLIIFSMLSKTFCCNSMSLKRFDAASESNLPWSCFPVLFRIHPK